MFTSTKFYATVVTLPMNNPIKFLENIKPGFKKQFLGINTDLKSMQPRNSDLDYTLIQHLEILIG